MALSSLASFRVATRGVATAGFLAASILGTFTAARAQTLKTAAAGQSESVTPTTDCNTRITSKEILGDTKCEIVKGKLLDARGKALDDQGKVLDAQLAKEKQGLACLQKIKIFFDAGKVSRETIIRYGKDRACDLAKTLG